MTVDQLTTSGPAVGERRRARRSTRIRWIAAGLAVAVIGALVLVVLTRGPDNVGTAREIRSAVEVKSGAGRFQPVAEHPAVSKGDVVRTNDEGLGTIDYGDGSVTRLDSNTVFEVDELLTSGTRRVVRASLSEGRVWNRVKKLTSSGDRFEVRTPNAVATVRGTTFTCETDPLGLGLFDTTCIQVTGRTDVTFDNGAQSRLGPGECTTNGGPCKYTPAEILKILSKFADLDGIELPWTKQKDEKSDTTTAEDLTSLTTDPRSVIDDAAIPASDRPGRSSPSGDDEEQDDQGEDDSSALPQRDTRPTNSDSGDDDGDQNDGDDSGSDGDGEDPGGDEDEEDDGNRGCGDGEGGGRGGGCPHNES